MNNKSKGFSENLIERTLSTINQFEERNANLGGSFNLFSILEVERMEVSTHSAFIFELINPNGSHCQNTLYLKLFCENVLKIYDFDYLTASVEREKFAGEFGRIDLLISSSNYKVIVELKVDAEDQPCQMQRYYEYLNIKRTKNQKTKLFYLTLEGSIPSEYSFGQLDEIAKRDIQLISFRKDIHDWLESCIQARKVEKVNGALSQYLDLIKKMTNNSETEMDNTVKKLIMESVDSYKAALCISNAVIAARQDILNRFILELKEKLNHSDIFIALIEDDNFDKYYKLPKNRYAHLTYLLKETQFKDVNVYLCVEIEWKLYYSIWIAKSSEDGMIDWETEIEANCIEVIQRDHFRTFEGSFNESKASNCLGWQFIKNTAHETFNFYEVESEYNVEKLVDQEYLKDEVSSICEHLNELIKTLIF